MEEIGNDMPQSKLKNIHKEEDVMAMKEMYIHEANVQIEEIQDLKEMSGKGRIIQIKAMRAENVDIQKHSMLVDMNQK